MDQLFNEIANEIAARETVVPEQQAVPEELTQYLALLDYSDVSKFKKIKKLQQTTNHASVPKIVILEQGKLDDKYADLLTRFLNPTNGFSLNAKMRTCTLNVCILENSEGVITDSLLALSGKNNFTPVYVANHEAVEFQAGVKVILVPPVTHPQLHEHNIPWLQLFCIYYRKYRNDIPALNVALDGIAHEDLSQIRTTLVNIRALEEDQNSVFHQVCSRYKTETLAKYPEVNNQGDEQKLALELCLLEPAELFLRSILVASVSFQEELQVLANSNIEIQALRSSTYQRIHDFFEANFPPGEFGTLRGACTTAIDSFRQIPLETVYTKLIQPCAEDNFLGLLVQSPETLQVVRAAHSVKIFSLSKHRQLGAAAPTQAMVRNAVIPPCRGCQLHFPHDLCRVIAPEGVDTTYSVDTVSEQKVVVTTTVRTAGGFNRRGARVTINETRTVEEGHFVRANEDFLISKAPPA